MSYGHLRRAEAEYPPFLAERGHLAACTAPTADLFTSYGDRRGTRRAREDAAKAVCARCPLRLECRRWATDTLQEGVWGGTNDGERAMARYHGGFPDERIAAARAA